MDDPRNYQYDESDSESNEHYYESDEDSNETSFAIGASPEQFKSILNKEEKIEKVQDIKKNLENAIEIYQTGVSPEAEKQIGYLQEKLQTCDDKISQLETESKDKGKGKAK
jgi:hypothetical protein